jgi:hypothetical protein
MEASIISPSLCGMSNKHTLSVPLCLNLDTGATTPLFHVMFDEYFAMVATNHHQYLLDEDDQAEANATNMEGQEEGTPLQQLQVSQAQDRHQPPQPFPTPPPPQSSVPSMTPMSRIPTLTINPQAPPIDLFQAPTLSASTTTGGLLPSTPIASQPPTPSTPVPPTMPLSGALPVPKISSPSSVVQVSSSPSGLSPETRENQGALTNRTPSPQQREFAPISPQVQQREQPRSSRPPKAPPAPSTRPTRTRTAPKRYYGYDEAQGYGYTKATFDFNNAYEKRPVIPRSFLASITGSSTFDTLPAVFKARAVKDPDTLS